MDTKSLPKTTTARTMRGLALFKERGGEIERVYPHVYRVPSCSGETSYMVHLSPRERCDCPDAATVCKHIIAATLKAAKARRRAA